MDFLVARQEAEAAAGQGGAPASITEKVTGAVTSAVKSAAAAATEAATGKSGKAEGGGGGSKAASGGGQIINGMDKKTRKALLKAKIYRANFIMWWVTTGVIGALAILYLLRMWRAHQIRKRVAAKRAAGTAGVKAGKGSSLGAAHAGWSNLAYVRTWPLWIYGSTSAAEWFWTAAYTGICLGVGFWGCISPVTGKLDYANPIGVVAFAQMPLIVGLASRNNVISYMTGISYEKLNYLHRASGRVCVLTTWLHTLGWFHKGLGKHGPGTVIFLSGMLGSVAVLVLWLTSFQLVRKTFYELFLFFHITMGIMFIVASYYHWPRMAEWTWIALLLWGIDRFVAFARLFFHNKTWLMWSSARHAEHSGSTVELIDDDVVRVTVNRPLFKWSPGQHAFLTMPGVALLRYEQHPFTIVNIPDETGDVVFIFRALQGFTRRLVNRLDATVTTDINCYIEGPYGGEGFGHGLGHGPLQQHDAVILVAGGTGISASCSQFLNTIRCSREGTTAVASCRLVWNVRSARALAWIAPLLNAEFAKGAGSTRFHIDVYVTRSAVADDPTAEGQKDRAQFASLADEDSPEGSPAGSTENVHETNEKTSPPSSAGSAHGPDEKYAAAAGLAPAVAAIVQFHQGRSPLERIVRDDTLAATGEGDGVGVAVCGPTSLAMAARDAVVAVNRPAAIASGHQQEIHFHSEVFGW